MGLAARERGVAGRVTGLVRRSESVEECVAAGAVDDATLDLAEAVADAGLVILCTPVGGMSDLAEQIQPHLAPEAIITDVGSVKGPVVAAVEPVLPRFIGSHPLCGSEKAGVAHARVDLLEGAVCAVTPSDASPADAVEAVTAFWSALGSRVVNLSAADHDAICARTSHLPHVLASALVNAVLAKPRAGENNFLGTGFRDTARKSSCPRRIMSAACATVSSSSSPSSLIFVGPRALNGTRRRRSDAVRDVGSRGDTSRGGGIFLHVDNGNKTAGCIAVKKKVMRNLMKWLDPKKDPVIVILVT